MRDVFCDLDCSATKHTHPRSVSLHSARLSAPLFLNVLRPSRMFLSSRNTLSRFQIGLAAIPLLSFPSSLQLRPAVL